MNRLEAEDILIGAINEAYPVWSSISFQKDYDNAMAALNYLLGGCKND